MITIRRSRERGHFNHGWLDTAHTFSFGDYHDAQWTRFSVLRVINEDFVQPGQGFAPHSHRDMEIITYVFEGALEHKDSMGNTSVIRAGDVQRMSAGRGVTHSEYNGSQRESVHLLQIWIFPKEQGIEPGYEQKTFGAAGRINQLRLIVSPDGRQESLSLHQDILLYDCLLEAGRRIELPLKANRRAWLQVIRGSLSMTGGLNLSTGDGAAMVRESSLELTSALETHFLFFDLPAHGEAA